MAFCLSRMGWIASCLCYAGRFGSAEKKILKDAFEVSDATISRDQAKLWSALADDGSVELSRGKLIVRDQDALELPKDMPIPSLGDWLEVMMESSYAQVVGPARIEPKDSIIRAMVRGIRERKALKINYLSKSSPDSPRWRLVSPHALVQASGRYHALCWDHDVAGERDFVLTRVRAAIVGEAKDFAYHPPSPDGSWNSGRVLEVRLADEQPLSIACADYGLDETGFKKLRIQKALAPYVISERRKGFEDLVKIIDPEQVTKA